MIQLPRDFKEFLKLLEDEGVRYLLIGGYAVGCHGYPRPTGDMDIWIESSPDNAARCVRVFKRFGVDVQELSAELFLADHGIVRIGVPPLRIEIHTGISGVEFEECYPRRQKDNLDGQQVNLISYNDLKENKRASGRLRDLDDLANLK